MTAVKTSLSSRSDGAREAYDAWHEAAEHDDSSAPWHAMVTAALPDMRDSSVLEIGCGRGGFTLALAARSARRPPEVVGADFSPVAIAIAEKRRMELGFTNVRFVVQDVVQLDWPDARFDVVISCETIEHVTEPAAALGELFRVLRRGGRLYLTFPSYLNLTGLYRLYLPLTGREYTEGGQPIHHALLAPVVRRWVRKAGFAIERSAATGHYVPFPGRSPIRLPLLDRLGPLTSWAGLHTLIVATKP